MLTSVAMMPLSIVTAVVHLLVVLLGMFCLM